jgi:hypothetical protein
MPRTVIDMAAVCSEEIVDIALDTAIRTGMPRTKFLSRLDELSVRQVLTAVDQSLARAPCG